MHANQDEFGKLLIVRTFIHRPSEIEWVGEGLRRAADLQLTAMSKDVPQVLGKKKTLNRRDQQGQG